MAVIAVYVSPLPAAIWITVRSIAICQAPAGSGPGTLLYPLHHHLDSTVGITDDTGKLIASQQYWPYGAVRSGGLSQTDK